MEKDHEKDTDEEESEPDVQVKCGLCGGTCDNGGTNPLHKCSQVDCMTGVHSTCAVHTYRWPRIIRDNTIVFCGDHAPSPVPRDAKVMKVPRGYSLEQ